MPLLKAEEVVEKIVTAQRKGIQEVSIPGYLYPLANIARLVPSRSAHVIKVRDY